MKASEANKIIAEYMGYEVDGLRQDKKCNSSIEWFADFMTVPEFTTYDYSESLDALVPVWHKLEMVPLFKQGRLSKCYWCKLQSIHPFAVPRDGFCSEENHNTMSEAAAIATAKAIKGLE